MPIDTTHIGMCAVPRIAEELLRDPATPDLTFSKCPDMNSIYERRKPLHEQPFVIMKRLGMLGGEASKFTESYLREVYDADVRFDGFYAIRRGDEYILFALTNPTIIKGLKRRFPVNILDQMIPDVFAYFNRLIPKENQLN
jgi:hypothetical protein